MRVSYIISGIDKAYFFEQTLVALREEGFEVSVILINCENGELSRFLESNDFVTEHIQLKRLSQSAKAIFSCRRILNRWKPDIVHTHLAEATFVGLWSARLTGIKRRIYTRHSGEPLHKSFKEGIIDKLQNRLANRIVAISPNVQEILHKQQVSPEKIELISHGFELHHFDKNNAVELDQLRKDYIIGNNAPIVGVVSRFMELKGIQYIIPAFQKLLEKHPEAQLLLFGANETGDFYEEIMTLLNVLPKNSFKIIPFEHNLYAFYRLFDIYIHTPINETCEGFGQTYVEVLAAGIPSIFTLSGIAKEFIVHEKNAMVVPFQDSDAIYDASIKLLSDETLRTKLIANGKSSIEERFQFQKYIAKLASMYRSNF